MRASALPAWHAWSMFRFRRRCGHEHFNTSVEPVRFLAFHPPGMLAYPGWSGEGDHFIGKGSNQIEYEDEDPEIRAAFEAELAKNGLQSRCGRSSVKNAGKYKRPSRSAVGNCLLLLIS